jgi:hypothetical protein
MPVKFRPLPQVSTRDAERFWANVDIRSSAECWPWTAGVNSARDGYGRFWIKRIEYRTNRMAYWLHYGIDPDSEDACHTCDNPPCCNPAHLFKGTRAQNLADMRSKKRQAIGERHGISKLTDGQVSEIKRRYIPRKVSMYKLADEFSVSEMTVNNIIHGKIWRHVTD